jgi:hypothetical protein
MATRKIAQAGQLDEFKSVDGQSELPGPTSHGGASRPADKSTGETSYSATTKAEVMAKLMQDLQARSADEVLDVYKAVTSNSPQGNRRPADKMQGGGETYDTTTHSPTAVSPVVARENVEEIFTGEEISEELMDKAAIIFEAAVNARISIVEARLEEQFSEALQEAIDLVHEEVVESVDKYMSYVAKEWMEENKLAIDNGLKAEMAEEMLLGLKEMFEANYITVSEEKTDVLSSMAEEIDVLKTRLNEEVEARLALEEELEDTRVADLVADVTEGMTVSERDKFMTFAENITYTDIEDFSKKVETIKETYFSGKNVSNAGAEPLTEDYSDDAEEKAVPANMRVYADALSRIVKK